MVRKVLSICYEQCLPDSTVEFLERADCHMMCVRAVGTAIQAFNTAKFDVVLINQTVSGPAVHLLVRLMREKSDVPIVCVSEDLAAERTGVNVWLQPPVSPEELLRVISELVPP